MPSTARGDALALHYTAPGRAELRPVALAAVEGPSVLVRTLWSGISRGTERLVFEGRLPRSEWQRMRAPFQEGDFPFPVKYGYAVVGVVEEGPSALMGRTVFALHPHQDRFRIDAAAAVPVPEGVPARRAVLAANMGTALNALWDSGAGAADRIVIVGGGILGLLVASLAARLPGAEVTVVDVDPSREEPCRLLGARFTAPDAAPGDADIVFHASATEAGLRLALDAAGFEGTVVELSWFGDSEVTLALGGGFHAKRLRLVSSQVSAVSPSRRPRWSPRRRQEAALALLADPRFDALVTAEVAFADLPRELPGILAPGAPGLATVVRYAPQ